MEIGSNGDVAFVGQPLGDAPVGVAPGSGGEATATSPSLESDTFEIGDLKVKNRIFDDILNARKLELLNDPEIQAMLAAGGRRVGKAGNKVFRVK